jgi:glycine oxidase
MASEPSAGLEPFVVVGAGVIGLAVAYELARRGLPVVVCEQEPGFGGASTAAGGMLAPISEADVETPALVSFALDSAARYPQFVRTLEQTSGIGCGLSQHGTLWLALDRDDLTELERLASVLRAKGLPVEPMDARAARELEPHVSHRVIGALRLAADHQVDPRRLVASLAVAIRKLGGTIRHGARVTEIHESRVSGTVEGGATFAIDARAIVLAAGAWSGAFAAPPPRPVKGQLVRLRGPRLLRHVVRTPRVYLIPRDDGELLVGATMEEMGFDATPTAGAVLDLLRDGWEVLPAIHELALAEISVGLRSAVDDHLPVIGQSDVPGLFLAYGHFRNGVLLAAGTAHHLAEWLERGVAPAELSPFAPRRAKALGSAAGG